MFSQPVARGLSVYLPTVAVEMKHMRRRTFEMNCSLKIELMVDILGMFEFILDLLKLLEMKPVLKFINEGLCFVLQ